MSQSKFFQQWHASLEEQAANAYAASPATSTAGPSQERPSKFCQEWHAALEEQAQLAARAVYAAPKPATAPVSAAVPTRQREIKRLFRAIDKELASADCIGVQHPLFAEWQELQQQYVQLEAQYQKNVRSCSMYLTRTMHIFHPEALTGPHVVQADTALTEILRVVRLMQEEAKRVEYFLYDLQDEIEAFPTKVMLAARSANTVKSRGLSGWLKKLRASVSKPVKALLKALGRSRSRSHIHLRLGSSDNVALCSEKAQYAGQPEQESIPSTASCQLLLDALSDLIDASQLIERACDDLFQASYLGSITSSTLIRGEYMQAASQGSARLYAHLDLVARM
ncbi:uncharacterized protein B0H18DRAFT_951105 [Fomitopsis serialis]|uniref:uncharacterized protein n=1 Tax=Fomitopsis serialis TaxID=139415 RepID=UPI0020079255|nr:uncharacterized protein B0H18DRAFT_951105 [Neoantrodia serialis]KAH9935613.1 hypothetical protein B0H18DRAFT_951105 [Neoantrodia serialis]